MITIDPIWEIIEFLGRLMNKSPACKDNTTITGIFEIYSKFFLNR